jgi:hypothetical protein
MREVRCCVGGVISPLLGNIPAGRIDHARCAERRTAGVHSADGPEERDGRQRLQRAPDRPNTLLPRDPTGRRVPRARVLPGTPPGAADHHLDSAQLDELKGMISDLMSTPRAVVVSTLHQPGIPTP